jgi:DNA primase catalytic core
MNKVLEDAVKLYQKQLKIDKASSRYLESRGILPRTIKHFGLGSAIPSNMFFERMGNLGHNIEDIKKENLSREYMEKETPVFYNAITIPITNNAGEVINISGRNFSPYTKCKYLNLPGTSIDGFYGENLIKNRFAYSPFMCKELDYVFITEGQFDCMILHQNNIFSLGVLGTQGIRESMFDTLKIFDGVVLCFDNDSPGEKASMRFAKNIRYIYPNMEICFLKLPDEYNDISDFFNAGHKKSELSSLIKTKEVTPEKFKKNKKSKGGDFKHNTTIQELKQINIADIIKITEPTVKLTDSFNTKKAICPFKDHEEVLESFTVYPENNTYYCFGCGRGGDVIDFIMEYYKISFTEACKTLKKIGK